MALLRMSHLLTETTVYLQKRDKSVLKMPLPWVTIPIKTILLCLAVALI